MKGKLITLRLLTMEDLPNCTRWVQDMEIMQHVTGETTQPDAEKIWLEKTLRDPSELLFAIIVNATGEHIGNCGIHLKFEEKDQKGVCLGIMIGEKLEWGKGYGPEVMTLLATYAHDELEEQRAWLSVDIDHPRAMRAYEKAGFTVVQKRPHPKQKQMQYIMEHVCDAK